MIEVLDHGGVQLIEFAGSDARVAQAARVSLGNFDKPINQEKDAKLINYLMKHRHGSPFEHNLFTFYIKAPIFVVREWMRHRIGSFNEISGRYSELNTEFYNPKPLRRPDPNNKQGSVPYYEDSDEYDGIRRAIRQHGDASARLYHGLLDKGIARELARLVLPLNTYTEFVWTVNARSLMNFLSLRNSDDAQWEIREYAKVIEDLASIKMPATMEAFKNNGRGSP